MRSWPVQEAKARFGELLDRARREGPQLVTRRGAEAAVLVPIERWRELERAVPTSLKDLLLAPAPEVPDIDALLPPRGKAPRREAPGLD